MELLERVACQARPLASAALESYELHADDWELAPGPRVFDLTGPDTRRFDRLAAEARAAGVAVWIGTEVWAGMVNPTLADLEDEHGRIAVAPLIERPTTEEVPMTTVAEPVSNGHHDHEPELAPAGYVKCRGYSEKPDCDGNAADAPKKGAGTGKCAECRSGIARLGGAGRSRAAATERAERGVEEKVPAGWLKVPGTGLAYRTPQEAFVAADEIEADGERVAEAARAQDDHGKADQAIDASRELAEKIRVVARAAIDSAEEAAVLTSVRGTHETLAALREATDELDRRRVAVKDQEGVVASLLEQLREETGVSGVRVTRL